MTPPVGPMAGRLVVDLSRALAGPHATMMMGDLGASVIKVEAAGGDESRQWGPPFVGPDEAPILGSSSARSQAATRPSYIAHVMALC